MASAARTVVTGAENAGRVASYKRAQAMGIKLMQEWVATIDGRTRASHRQLDGEVVEVGEKFGNGCRYPGDPQGKPWEVYNCRCTLVAAVEGVDASDAARWNKLPPGMTYEEWKQGGSRASKAAGSDEPAARQHDAESAAKSIQASLSSGQELSANVVRSIVGKVVTLGPESGKSASDYLDLNGVGKHDRKIFDEAVQLIPRTMLETVRLGGVRARRDMGETRSWYDREANEVVIAKGADKLTVVHELMHAVESHDRGFLAAEAEYFAKRTKGKQLKSLRDLTGVDYDDWEMTFDVGKACVDAYAFKFYGNKAFELMSVGVEMIYRNPAAYLRDPSMLKWVLEMVGRF